MKKYEQTNLPDISPNVMHIVCTKKGFQIFETLKPLILLWAQLDLNQRPADYESAALTVWAMGPDPDTFTPLPRLGEGLGVGA